MQILDLAVEAIQKSGLRAPVTGATLAAAMEKIAACGEQAVKIWRGYLDNPGQAGDKYTLLSWVGAERAMQLHELGLKTHELVQGVCAATGDQARFLVLDESPIRDAYLGLKDGQTGVEAAQQQLEAQQAMNKHIRALADKVRVIKPATKAAQKPSVKKSVPKVAKKKAAAKKKAVAKKPASKKAVKKAAKKK